MNPRRNGTEAPEEHNGRTSSTVVWLFQRGVRAALCLIAVLAAAASIVLGADGARAQETSGIDSPEVSMEAAQKAGEVAARYPAYDRPDSMPTAEALAYRDRETADAERAEQDPGVLRNALASIIDSDSLPFVDVGGAMAAGGYEPGEIFAVTQARGREDGEQVKEDRTPPEDFVRPVLDGGPEPPPEEPVPTPGTALTASPVPPAPDATPSGAPAYEASSEPAAEEPGSPVGDAGEPAFIPLPEEPSEPSPAEPDRPEGSEESEQPTFIIFPQEGSPAPPADAPAQEEPASPEALLEEQNPPADGFSEAPPEEAQPPAEDGGGLVPGNGFGLDDPQGGFEETGGGDADDAEEDRPPPDGSSEAPSEEEGPSAQDDGSLVPGAGFGLGDPQGEYEEPGEEGGEDPSEDETRPTPAAEDTPGAGFGPLPQRPGEGEAQEKQDGDTDEGGSLDETTGEGDGTVWGDDPGAEDPDNGQPEEPGQSPGEDAGTDDPGSDETAPDDAQQGVPEEEAPGRISPEPPSNSGQEGGVPGLGEAFGDGGGPGENGPQDDRQEGSPQQDGSRHGDPQQRDPDQGDPQQGEPDGAVPDEQPGNGVPAEGPHKISDEPASIGRAFGGSGGRDAPERGAPHTGREEPSAPGDERPPGGKGAGGAGDAEKGGPDGAPAGEIRKDAPGREPASRDEPDPKKGSPAGMGAAFDAADGQRENTHQPAPVEPDAPGVAPAAPTEPTETAQPGKPQPPLESTQTEPETPTFAEAMGTARQEKPAEESPDKEPAPADVTVVPERRGAQPAEKPEAKRGEEPEPRPKPGSRDPMEVVEEIGQTDGGAEGIQPKAQEGAARASGAHNDASVEGPEPMEVEPTGGAPVAHDASGEIALEETASGGWAEEPPQGPPATVAVVEGESPWNTAQGWPGAGAAPEAVEAQPLARPVAAPTAPAPLPEQPAAKDETYPEGGVQQSAGAPGAVPQAPAPDAFGGFGPAPAPQESYPAEPVAPVVEELAAPAPQPETLPQPAPAEPPVAEPVVVEIPPSPAPTAPAPEPAMVEPVVVAPAAPVPESTPVQQAATTAPAPAPAAPAPAPLQQAPDQVPAPAPVTVEQTYSAPGPAPLPAPGPAPGGQSHSAPVPASATSTQGSAVVVSKSSGSWKAGNK
jgi:hypothetical protein